MSYFKMKYYKFLGFEKSKRKNKMYNGILERKIDKKIVRIPFGSTEYQNYQDKTGLNLYPELIHGDEKRRRLYRLRHQKNIISGYYSAGYLSIRYLW